MAVLDIYSFGLQERHSLILQLERAGTKTSEYLQNEVSMSSYRYLLSLRIELDKKSQDNFQPRILSDGGTGSANALLSSKNTAVSRG